RAGGDRRPRPRPDRAHGRNRLARVIVPGRARTGPAAPSRLRPRRGRGGLRPPDLLDVGGPADGSALREVPSLRLRRPPEPLHPPGTPANAPPAFSKGHASPLLYSLYKAAGAIDDEELLSFRQFDSRLQGHPTPEIPWVDVATGSLGQGLPIAVGIALAASRLEGSELRGWVLCGDSAL